MLVSRVVIMRTTWIFLAWMASGSLAARTLERSNQQARINALERRVAQLEIVVERLSAPAVSASERVGEVRMVPASFSQSASAPAGLPPLVARPRSALPQELLPNLGKIGAVVSFTTGFNGGAFKLGGGSYLGGSVQLPLALVPGGRLSYEFSAGLAQSSRELPTTSNVAQVANLAVLSSLRPSQPAANLSDALGGTGAAPFAVTQNANWQAQTVQIVPFALRYSWTRLDRWHLRPYAVVGLGAYVTTSHQTAAAGLRSDADLPPATNQLLSTLFSEAPFTGPLIGGQITSSSQLQATHLPSGQGGTDLGIHSGVGMEWLFPSGLSLSVDGRLNVIPSGTNYKTLAAQWGWRF